MSSYLSRMASVLDAFLTFWFQAECFFCHRRVQAGFYCDRCRFIQPIQPPTCDICGKTLSANLKTCLDCYLTPPKRIKRIHSLLWLNEPTRQVLHQIKFHGKLSWLNCFKPSVVLQEFDYLPNDITIVPVPLHITRYLKRGYNLSDHLGTWLCQKISGAHINHRLVKSKRTAPQSQLRRSKRLKNLRGSFQWRSSKHIPKSVLIVDDVYTTGATLENCARALWKAGCRDIYAVTLFRTP